MQKLSMCRICLVENVRMYLVANKNLQEIYEKLTDTPLVTEDSRPMLACYFCYTKLKQSLRLQRKCLEAETWFAQILINDYETTPRLNQDRLQFSGYVISPIESVSIFDECQIKNDAVKEELQDVCEGKVIQNQTDLQNEFQDIENVNIKSCHSESEDIPAHYSESNSKEVPFLEFKTEFKEEQEDIPTYYSESKDIPPLQSELDSEDYVPLIEFKTEVEYLQEVSKNNLQIKTTQRTPDADLQKEDQRRAIPGDKITTQQKKSEKANTNIVWNTHNKTSTPSNELKETFTASSSSTFDYLKNPIRINNGEKQYECKICLRSFRDNNDLIKHAGVHTGVEPYKCKICQRSFTAKGALTKHIRIHNGENPYKRKIKYFDNMPKHLNEKTFECDICQRSFREKGGLRRHIILHSGEKPFKCHVCQKSFAVSSNLKRHIERHTGNKNIHKCDICQRSFSEKSSLKRHSSVHTGEKPYKCERCHRSFSEMSPLTKHMRRHTGEKPFKCDVCQRNFSDASNLKRHIRIHMSAMETYSATVATTVNFSQYKSDTPSHFT